jgi:hypothetical protein
LPPGPLLMRFALRWRGETGTSWNGYLDRFLSKGLAVEGPKLVPGETTVQIGGRSSAELLHVTHIPQHLANDDIIGAALLQLDDEEASSVLLMARMSSGPVSVRYC